MSAEDLYIKKIEALTRGIRLGTKKPSDVATEVASAFNKLKASNIGMYDDLLNKYNNVVSDFNKKNTK